MKKSFLAITEVGRVKGLRSISVHQIIKNEPVFIFDFTMSLSSHRGFENEVASELISKGYIPPDKVNGGGYIIYNIKDYSIFIIEGKGLNYYSKY